MSAKNSIKLSHPLISMFLFFGLAQHVFACTTEFPLKFPEVHACGKMRVIIPKNSYEGSFDLASKTFKNITVTDPNVDRGNTPVTVALKLVDDGYVLHEVLSDQEVSRVHFRNFMDQLCGVNHDCGTSAEYSKFSNGEFFGALYFTRKSRFASGPTDWNIEIQVRRRGYSTESVIKDSEYRNI